MATGANRGRAQILRPEGKGKAKAGNGRQRDTTGDNKGWFPRTDFGLDTAQTAHHNDSHKPADAPGAENANRHFTVLEFDFE